MENFVKYTLVVLRLLKLFEMSGMNKSSIPSVVNLSSKVLIQEIDGESVLLNIESEQYFGLNQVGTRLVDYLSKSGRLDDAIEGLLSEFDIEEEILRRDIALLINAMREQELVEFGEG